MDWDDLRFALAVSEAGSLAAAARRLGVNHTTVLRRVNGLEAKLGVRLFERLATGYVPTVAGAEALAVAGRLGATVETLRRRLAGRDLRLSGPLRVTTVDTLVMTILMPHFAAFGAANPDVTLEIVVSSVMANLTRRDADVAIRAAVAVPDTLVGRRVCDIPFAIYGPDPDAAIDRGPWIGFDESLAETAVAQWMRGLPPSAVIACRVDSMMAAREAARAGFGIALLPCHLGDGTPDLVRLGPPVPDVRPSLWLLTHEDLRRTTRVRAFLDFMARRLLADRDLLEGRRA